MHSLKPAAVAVCLLVRMLFVREAYAKDEAYKAIMGLPDGIEVIHTPDRPRAILGGVSGLEYTWHYATSVRGTDDEVRIIAFGAFVREHNRWLLANYTGRPFIDADFADWYACPDSTTDPTRSCTDSGNWSGANRLRSMRIVWSTSESTSTARR